MSAFEAIVADGTGSRKPKVNERSPSFQPVMSITVKEIGSADGDAGCCGFDSCKGSLIVYDIVGEKNLLPAAAAHVQG